MHLIVVNLVPVYCTEIQLYISSSLTDIRVEDPCWFFHCVINRFMFFLQVDWRFIELEIKAWSNDNLCRVKRLLMLNRIDKNIQILIHLRKINLELR